MSSGGMVFGIGLSKTGTHSLTQAINLLDIPCVHYPDPALMLEGRFIEAFGDNDAATDISVAAFFRELDEAYPGSRFILTTREIEPWLDSVEDHRRRREHEDVTTCRKAYFEHEQKVRAYFAEQPEYLLVWDLCANPGWEPLCGFLGVAIPGERFPRLNARRAA